MSLGGFPCTLNSVDRNSKALTENVSASDGGAESILRARSGLRGVLGVEGGPLRREDSWSVTPASLGRQAEVAPGARSVDLCPVDGTRLLGTQLTGCAGS